MQDEMFKKYQKSFTDLWQKVKEDDLCARFSFDLAECIYRLMTGNAKTDPYWTDAASRICIIAKWYRGLEHADEWARTILWWADSVAMERYKKTTEVQ